MLGSRVAKVALVSPTASVFVEIASALRLMALVLSRMVGTIEHPEKSTEKASETKAGGSGRIVFPPGSWVSRELFAGEDRPHYVEERTVGPQILSMATRGHGMPTPWKLRIFLKESAFAAVAFTGAIYLYFLTANWGVQDYLVEGPLKDYLGNPVIHLQHLLAGMMFGGLLGVVNRLAESRWLRSRPFGLLILLRSVFYAVGLCLIFLAVVLLFLLTSILSTDSLRLILEEFSLRYLLSIGIWLSLVAIGVNFLLEVRRLVGEENVWPLLTGHYRRPRHEDRVFLFMDLAGSVTAAERLGHKRYSEFIQECFQDLTMVALKYGGRIYQYVGDEIVMTWPAQSADSRAT